MKKQVSSSFVSQKFQIVCYISPGIEQKINVICFISTQRAIDVFNANILGGN